jgi:hypothetical protein
MQAVNPYAPPQQPSSPRCAYGPPTLGFARAVGMVAILAGGGAILGAALGLAIGLMAPDYYHAVFRNAHINTLQVGFTLGLTQGLGTGLVVGCVITLAVALSRRRMPPAG